MDKETKRLVELSVAWIGPLFILGYLVCWAWLGHNFPPPNFMDMTGAELVSEFYGKYQSQISLGMIGCCFVGMLYLPWSILLATKLRDANGDWNVLSLMEFAGGILTAWVLAFCPAIWAACAVLVHELDPQLVKAMHSFAWFIYDCTFMITTVQLTGLGVYVILGKQTIFPKWTGWSAIAVGIIFMPLLLIPFIKSGPFAVGGTWNYFIVFGTWLFAFFAPFTYYLLKEVSGGRERLPFAAAHGR